MMVNDHKLIGFDLDGTLCHPVRPFDEIFEQAFGIKKSTVADVWMAAIQADGARTGIDAIKAILPNSTQQQADEHLLNFSKLWAEQQKLFDGVELMLKRLKDEGHLLTLITNGPSVMQHAVIDHLGIRGYFDHAFTTGDEALAINKPNAQCFAKVANYFDVAAKDCLFVGDGEVNDYRGALSAGWHGLWVAPTNEIPAKMFNDLTATPNQNTAHRLVWV